MLTSATPTHAFDGERKGFVLGFSAGASVTSFTQTLSGTFQGETDRENKFGFGTSFRIGGAFNEQFMFYYVNNVAWFSLENALGETVTIANGVGLIGVSYYLQPTPGGWYLLGVIGVSTWDAVFENSSASTGFGLGGGVGWEFAPHWSVEAVAEWGKPSDSEAGVDLETNAVSILVMIAGTAY
jgi:hypothetical protein